MATVNLSSIITPANVLTASNAETLTNKTINIASNTLTGVQSTLVSGTSIKTINSTSLLGSGDIVVGGSAATPTALGTVYAKQTTSGGTPFLTALGYNAAVGTTGVYCTAVGTFALESNSTGTYNTTIGSYSMYGNTSGAQNTASGYYSVVSNETGSNNTAMGYESLYGNTSGSNSVAVGWKAMKFTSTGGRCTAVGRQALLNNTTATGNSAFGLDALLTNTTGEQNTAVGEDAMRLNSTGLYNTGLGFQSLYAATANSNTGVGAYAGSGITTGQSNVVVGGLTSAGGSAPAFAITTESNRISMGSTSVTNAYIQVAFTVVSDARDKMNFAPVPHGLDFVKQLNPVQYQFKEFRESNVPHGSVRYGFKAQDILALEGSNPVIIDAEDSEKLRYNGESLVPVLVKALQELSAKFDAYVASHS